MKLPYIITDNKIDRRKLRPLLDSLRGQNVLVQHLGDEGNAILKEAPISGGEIGNNVGEKYFRIRLTEEGTISPAILVGKTSENSQLARITLPDRQIVYEDPTVVRRWDSRYSPIPGTFGFAEGKRLFEKYGLTS